MKIKMLIIDDHKLFIEGLVSIFSSLREFEIYSFNNSFKDLEDNILLIQADLILLDINLNGENGLELGRNIKMKYPNIYIIILSMYNHTNLINKAKEYKLNGFLLKEISTNNLVNSINRVIFGKENVWMYPQNTISDPIKDFFKLTYGLTKREIEIIQLLSNGMENESISEKLFLSYHTVKTHRKNIYEKLKIKTIRELLNFARKNNMI